MDDARKAGLGHHDLAIPTYIDTNSLLDLLASLEGGFSMVERLTTQGGTTRDNRIEASGEFGVANVLNLLKLNLRGSRTRATSEQSSAQVEQERYHTYGSLLYRLRGTLEDAGLIKRLSGEAGDWDAIGPSDFVELHGVFRPNPLAESLATVLRLLGIMRSVVTVPEGGGRAKGEQRAAMQRQRAEAQAQLKELDQVEKLLRGVLDDIESEHARLFVVEMGADGARSAVMRLFYDFARDRSLDELAHGEFRFLGKVVRNLSSHGGEAIDLLQGTGMGGVGDEMIETLLGGFRDAAQEGLRLPEIRTRVEAPALQVVPVGVYV